MPGGLLSIILLAAVFYFMLIMPEKKKQKKAKEMMNALEVGDEIFTRGGINGKIVDINENIVTIATGPDNVKINISRQAVGTVTKSEVAQEVQAPEIQESEVKSIDLEKKEESQS